MDATRNKRATDIRQRMRSHAPSNSWPGSYTPTSFKTKVDARPSKYMVDIIGAEAKPHQAKQYARFYRAEPRLLKKASVLAQARLLSSPVVQKPKPVSSPIQQVLAKETQPVSHDPAIQKKRFGRYFANATIGVALFMSSLLGFMAWRYHTAIQKVEAKPQEVLSATDDSAEPEPNGVSGLAETPITGNQKGSRVADAPTYLSIPKLTVAGYVISVGQTRAGAMNVPGNIWQVGWYKNSATPKSGTGVVIVNGHVHGPTQPGIFASLGKLNAGDRIIVNDGSGAKYTYQVVKKQTYKAGDVGADLFESASANKQGLNLITCTGEIKDNEYQERIVVFTERV